MTQTHIVPPAGKNFDPLLHTERWHDSVVTFSFPSIAQHYMWKTNNFIVPSIYTTYYNLYPNQDYVENFSPVTNDQISVILKSLNDISQFTNVSFQQVEEYRNPFGPFGDVTGTLRFGRTANAPTASAYVPNEPESGGDAWFRTGKYETPILGNYQYHTILHEIGHAMGLRHGHEPSNPYGALAYSLDSQEFSLMTYRDYIGDSIHGYSSEYWSAAQSFMMLDIAALQHMYGADFSASGSIFSGDTRYTFSPTTGEMFINGQGQGTPGGNRIFRTIWDGHGNDTYDLSDYSTNLSIDLRPGEWSHFGRQLADLNAKYTGANLARGNVANALLYNDDIRSLIENAYGGFGNDFIRGNQTRNHLQGRDGNDILLGLEGNDTLSGGWGSDTLYGGDGNDVLFGHYDSDALYGEAGDDELWVDSPFIDFGEVYSGGSGVDTLHISATYDLRDAAIVSIEKIEFEESASGPPTTVLDLAASSFGDGFSLNSTVSGNSHRKDLIRVEMGNLITINLSTIILSDWHPDDKFEFMGDNDTEIVIGSRGSNSFLMGGGDDIIVGGENNDEIDGGVGADTMSGGSGSDTYYVDNVGDRVVETGGGGHDVVLSSISFELVEDQEIERLQAADAASTGKMTLVGNAFAQTITGNAGANTLDGGAGADTLIGLQGNDTYVVDNVADLVTEVKGGGTDTVGVLVSYALAAGQEIEILRLGAATGNQNLNLTGNEFAQALIGNSGNNILDGGAGADVMTGARGNDIYIVDSAADRVIEAMGGGTDTVGTLVSYALAAGQEVETLRLGAATGTQALNLTGNEFAQVLVGNGGNNVLDGKGGADVMTGARGNDTYLVDNTSDRVVEAKGGGSDTVFAFTSYALQAGQEIEALQLLTVTGTARLNLNGNEFGQKLVGNNGANTLDGRGGADLLIGRGGADSFVFSTALDAGNVDRIYDFAAEDTIRLSKSVFSAIAPGQLAGGAFKSVAAISTAKLDADDRILYKRTTGELYYDADGSGTAAAVRFAVLDNKAALTAADFLIV